MAAIVGMSPTVTALSTGCFDITQAQAHQGEKDDNSYLDQYNQPKPIASSFYHKSLLTLHI
jgi:hypothetical protein